jgi:hypothetical protein
MSSRTVDRTVVAVANLFNLIMVVIFIGRTRGVEHSIIYAWIWVAFIVLLMVTIMMNHRLNRRVWFVVLPLLMALFLMFELILDYVLQIPFRDTWVLGPYLLLYYAAIMGMIGYAFLTERRLGFLTLVTYFLSQIAALSSYFTVGHG